VKSFRFRFES